MTNRVLVSAPYMLPHLDRFRSVFEQNGVEVVTTAVNERLEEGDLLPLIGDIHGVICGDDRFTERVLDSAPVLKVISKWGTGIDSIDQDACRKRGIKVCNTPNAFSEAVADSALGYMLCFARRLPWMDAEMKAGRWEKIPGKALHECTLGVIGVGDVGKAVIRRASGFGMKILGNDIVDIDQDFLRETGTQLVEKEELLKASDFVSLHCDLNPESFHLMNADRFGLMKPTAVLINTARGPIVDEPALVAALEEGRIGGAGMDVFEDEPLPGNSPLLAMNQVMLAPHNSNSSPEAWERVHRNTINNLLEHIK